MRIRSVRARIINDSRKKPTIEVTVNGGYRAAAPSGTSVGRHEAQAYPKSGIGFAVNIINRLKELKGLRFEEFNDLEEVERLLPVIKANPMIALEFAILKAMSNNKIWEFLNLDAHHMPRLISNVVGGGAHSKGGTDIQEFLLLPSANRFEDAAIASVYCHKVLGRLLQTKKKTYEGAWAPELSTDEVLDMLAQLAEDAEKELGIKIDIGMDMAASRLWNGKDYCYRNFSRARIGARLKEEEQISFVKELISKYKLLYVEDPLHEDDFEGYASFARTMKKAMICGDDLVCTDIKRLERAHVNAVIIKPNQVGSLIKTKEIVDYAKKNRIFTVMSHRSGETTDATISHLAVAWEMPYIKCSVYGRERMAKINELIRIEEELSKIRV